MSIRRKGPLKKTPIKPILEVAKRGVRKRKFGRIMINCFFLDVDKIDKEPKTIYTLILVFILWNYFFWKYDKNKNNFSHNDKIYM